MICVGGTFEHLHAGHRKLLRRAFSLNGEVHIGLTADSFASEGRGRAILPYEKRLENLKEFLDSMGWENYRISPLNDEMGECLKEECTDLVVSEETAGVAEKINSMRIEKGLVQLRIHVVTYVLAEDFRPVSSSRIASGEIDEEGHLKRELRVAVGSVNPNKVDAVTDVISQFYDSMDVKAFAVESVVPEQPFNEDTIRGAINRAKNALHEWGDADIGVGIEAGLIYEPMTEKYYDVQYCAIADRIGWITLGHGPGFIYPKKVMANVSEGLAIGDAMKKAYGTENIGYKEGAIGFLTEGRYTRKLLSENAVIMAFVPRIRKEDYR